VVTDDARGLRPGASVYVSGVEVGQVRDVSLDDDGRATIVLSLDVDEAALSRETCASITAYGLAGERHLELTPRRHGDPPLRGATITCVEGGGSDTAARSAAEILDEIAAGRGTLGRLVRDPEIADALVRFLDGRCSPRPEGDEGPTAAAPPPPEPGPAPEREPEASAAPAATKRAPAASAPAQPRPAKGPRRGGGQDGLLTPWFD